MVIKSKFARVEQSMTTFWKEERQGYNIYQNEQNLFFWAGPPLYPYGCISSSQVDIEQIALSSAFLCAAAKSW